MTVARRFNAASVVPMKPRVPTGLQYFSVLDPGTEVPGYYRMVPPGPNGYRAKTRVDGGVPSLPSPRTLWLRATLFSGEVRLAFFDEGHDAFAEVLARGAGREGFSFGLELCLEVALNRLV